ncbi:NAD(P)-dependent oxidoreductase [Nocardioides anomalus]|uniref:NAD(P)-dependent oxidoreductase n=2 Tax=Nocardioides anomalus TaxID=2712223 RepID=A0A6G6WLS2_9ACTN|nr:NAD(P)-dependent oxidoreductase [Nocardioides anomalus]
MGAPMARRLLATRAPGDEVVVHDVRRDAVAALVGAGAVAAGSLAALAAAADAVCVVVRDDAEVRAVATELADHDPLVLVHATVHPDTPATLPGRVVDAPVSGGVGAAATGELAVMVGAAPEDFAEARPVLERLGTLVLHVGGPGAGTRLKLARNLVQYVAFGAAAEARRLVTSAGLAPDDLAAVMRHTDRLIGGPGVLVGREAGALDPAHLTALGHKDLDLALSAGAASGLELPLTQVARDRLADDLATLLGQAP